MSSLMEKSYTQPHNLMNIQLSSQLPLIPPKENSIRLFGKEFCGHDSTIIITNDSSSPATGTAASVATATTTTTAATATLTLIHHENKESKRIFECNYCSRNFSTSQALGGHQNAHRRERLHAKRTHIQSFTIHNNSSKPQLPTYPNHPLTTTTTTLPSYHHHSSNTRSIINHNNSSKSFYREKASYTSHQTPIYGRPLGSTRFPTSVQKLIAFNRGLLNYANTGSSSRSVYKHESEPVSFTDQVSLDLHL